MNERIKELAKQAGFDSVSMVAFDIKEDLEKFAELIVNDCILTIQMGITRDGHNTEKYLRSMKHIKQIREHFGIKE